jgi:hypothetical protein
MSAQQRQELIWRLARPSPIGSRTAIRRIRNLRLAATTASTVVLIPWIVVLWVTLPNRYVAHHWSLTWLGFDLVLVFMFALTAVLGWLRRQMVTLASFASGVLLLCDAWFDVTTASSSDRWVSVASAVLLEIPIAVLLMRSSFRLVRYMATRLWFMEPGASIWQLPIPIPEFWESGHPGVR